MDGQGDPLLEARIDMSLDDILKKEPGVGGFGGSGSYRGRGRKFATHSSPKPYERQGREPKGPSGPPPPVSFRNFCLSLSSIYSFLLLFSPLTGPLLFSLPSLILSIFL